MSENYNRCIEQAYVARNLAEAHLIKGFLESDGIACEVRGEHLIPAYGQVPITYDTLPSVWVEDGRRVTARQRIEQALHGKLGARWECSSCKELLEAQFTECWRCGSARQF